MGKDSEDEIRKIVREHLDRDKASNKLLTSLREAVKWYKDEHDRWWPFPPPWRRPKKPPPPKPSSETKKPNVKTKEKIDA